MKIIRLPFRWSLTLRREPNLGSYGQQHAHFSRGDRGKLYAHVRHFVEVAEPSSSTKAGNSTGPHLHFEAGADPAKVADMARRLNDEFRQGGVS